ncbi:vomeronasal type-1 receptor 4-like [Choloepus didactylus]|uniref:vomeronasal type-1 receptor 4-like n=1 Tax=Choloepus didactylus TaxID=27675 RepID=UPI00189DD62C|nr:vomeronasal type-1 receptor 4-like [Choloepus didactylus]
MSSRNLVIGMVFLSKTVAGVFGNLSVLYHYLFLYCSGGRLRSTDLIINHLLVANSLVLFSNGVPWTMAAFGWEQFPSDYGCKLLYYIYRVGRGVCIGSTCVLSIFQVIIISPRNSRWAELKVKAPRHKQRVQHIHRTSLSPRSSPESRATQTILLLFHNGDVSFWGHLTGGTWYQFVSSGLLLTSLTYSALCQISPLEPSLCVSS